ncbi:hypothetical protein niasHT_009476 [Heterodera trifolii]|uniref:Uncharacterized protein n=1 Tax=Heterodera trifolii TaxID=157864 RepID=A0ABD2MEI5_9BILA
MAPFRLSVTSRLCAAPFGNVSLLWRKNVTPKGRRIFNILIKSSTTEKEDPTKKKKGQQQKGQKLCPPLCPLEQMKHKLVVIRDEHSKLLGHRFLNSQLSLYLGSVQLFFCLWALTQHIWAMASLKKVLHCDFSPNSSLPPLLTHVDAIIFDIGLFHNLWGISGCVAQHLDGGYGRFCWCIAHSAALLFCLPFAFVSRPKPQLLWPLLIQQSAYGIGLLILSLAALPRAAHFLGDLSNAPLKAIAFYSLGTLMNFFLLYVYWHWYWHVETLWNSARKLRRGETFTGSTIKRPIRRYSPATIGGKMPLLRQNPIRNGLISGEGAERKKMPKGSGRESWANGETMREEGGGMEKGEEQQRKKQRTHGEEGGDKGEEGAQRHGQRQWRKIGHGDENGNGRRHGSDEHGNGRRDEDGNGRRNGRDEDGNGRKNGRDEEGNERRNGRDEVGNGRRHGPMTVPTREFDRANSLNSLSPSFGSTTASSVTSMTTSTSAAKTTHQQLNKQSIKKPPPPAPSPASYSLTHAICSSNFHRPFSPNKMAFPSTVRHFPWNWSHRNQRNQTLCHHKQHQIDHSLRCSSVDCPTTKGCKDGQQLVRQKNLPMEEFWGMEKGRDKRPMEFGFGSDPTDQQKKAMAPNGEANFWVERMPKIRSLTRRKDSDGESDDSPNGRETNDARGRDTFDPKGWSPTAESRTTTSWSTTTDNGHLMCHAPKPCHSRRQCAVPARPRVKAGESEKRRPLGGVISNVPLTKREKRKDEGKSNGGWSTSWSDSTTESEQRPFAPPALFGSSPLGMFGLSAIFAPPLEHRV